MKHLWFVAALCGSWMLTGCVPWWNHGYGGRGGHGGYRDDGH